MKLTRISLFLTSPLLLLLAIRAPAEECDCKQYEPLLKFSSTAETLSAIGLQAIHQDGKSFAALDDERAALRLRLSSLKMIPPKCRKDLFGKLKTRKLVGVLRANAEKKDFLVPSEHAAVLHFLDFELGYSYFSYCMNPNGKDYGDIGSSGCSGPGTDAYARFEDVLRDPAQSKKYGIEASELPLFRTYYSLLNQKSEKDAEALVRANKEGIDKEQFILLIQMLGERLYKNYDFSRSSGGPNSKGIVTGDALLAAARQNTVTGDEQVFAGICRDISSFQATLLRARGFPNAYVVAFTTNRSYHATAIAQDPDNPRKMYQFNYGILTRVKNLDGSRALFQGYEDSSINYRIFDPKGSLVTDVPSELGKILAEAAGFDTEHLDPLVRTTSSLLSVGHENARLITALDGNNARYLLAAGNYAYGQQSLFPGKIGFAAAYQQRPIEITLTDRKTGMAIGYVHGEQHLKLKPIRIGEHLDLVIDQSLTAAGAVSKITTEKQAMPYKFQRELRTNHELQLNQNSGRYTGHYRVGIQVGDSVRDVRNGDKTPIPAVVNTYADATGILRFSDFALIGQVRVVANELGVRGKLETGVVSEKVTLTGHVAGRLTSSSSLYQDNSIRRAGLNVFYRPSTKVTLGLTGEIPIEGENRLNDTLIMGTANLSY